MFFEGRPNSLNNKNFYSLMKHLLSACLIVLAATHNGQAQTTPLPYTMGFEMSSSWQTFRKGATDPNFKWLLDNTVSFSGKNLYHDYPVGGTSVTDDWYVSPAFSFSSGGKIDSFRYRFTGFGVPQAGDTVALYLLQGSPDPALATSITTLRDFRGTDYVADGAWKKASNINIPPKSGNCYIAFRYHTIVNWLDVRFDNLGLSGNATGLPEVYSPGIDFSIAPNPVSGRLQIRTKIAFTRLSIYDLSGRIVLQKKYEAGTDISALPSGSYLLELVDANQISAKTLFIKQ